MSGARDGWQRDGECPGKPGALSVGVDARDGSRTLWINYRTSQQIRLQADRLPSPQVSEVHDNRERRETDSVFDGPEPTIQVFQAPPAEVIGVGEWIGTRTAEGVAPSELVGQLAWL